jgi:hypothetical protein
LAQSHQPTLSITRRLRATVTVTAMAIIIGHGMDALRAGQCKVETARRIRDRVGQAFPVGRVIGGSDSNRGGLRLRSAWLA